jgi:hypothetical protein
MIAAAFLALLGVYLAAGFLFAVPFVFLGARRIDPHAGPATWGFRCLIIPGSMIFWPLLLWRWCRGIHEPPSEVNAHRHAARRQSGSEPSTRA